MKSEILSHEINIFRPTIGEVEVGYGVDFVYIMRTDTDFALGTLVDAGFDLKVIKPLYVEYMNKLFNMFQGSFSSKGEVQIHVFEAQELEQHVLNLAQQKPIISLDPLLTKGVHSLQISRGYYLGGKSDFGQVARPGSPTLVDQVHDIKSQLGDMELIVVEDDIFSGGSLLRGLEVLTDGGIRIAGVIPGIQVGNPTELAKMGIDVKPAVKYLTTQQDKAIFDLVDLGDPRDFLIGVDGLVVKLPSGRMGRLPYLLPYVSPTARAGIPEQQEIALSYSLLKFAKEFYQKVGNVRLAHVNPAFLDAMQELHGFSGSTTMEICIDFILENFNQIKEQIDTLEKSQL